MIGSQERRWGRNYIENFKALRAWQDSNMPIYGSFIGLDLILFLSSSRFNSSPYSLKDVFHSLNYSEGALRIFIRRLEKEGWIALETWPGDRRNKKIIISDHLMEKVEEFFQRISAIGRENIDPALDIMRSGADGRSE